MSPLLVLDQVSVHRGGRRVLDGLSFSMSAGERIALVGDNGAGKTTLLRTIVGLESATGDIRAFGLHCQSEADFRHVRAKAAYLFQDPDDQLFCPTVIEDVAFGPLNLGLTREQATTRAHDILNELELDHLANRITHHLSGGEKRLVSLAAILAMDPELLLLDEPSNALDQTHLERMFDILAKQKIAMLVVSHDWRLLERLTDSVVVLRDGQLSPAVLHRHPLWTEQVHLHDKQAGVQVPGA